ncbi:hypothetical protein [Aquidulcibacter sp.]|jgi:hypothetical protein|uniref:hypothetical protein n=1 Tax=Aquidulcibacter sp. TaxID=2052990 RepID=UPI0025C42893|nr:hypothetical protein [Aquidulcibacter sp.]MCA3064993.1 hypothetical protein [Rhodocyclaceae bacterium]MCA3694255.1 hypothetical protein [Aquidulcibacter sp.]
MIEYKKLAEAYQAKRERLQKQAESPELTDAQRTYYAGQLWMLRWVIELPTKTGDASNE